MTLSEVMAELKKMGTAQNIKIYKRHGAQDPMFGVSFGNLNKFKKKIKVDHDLAVQLWDSKNMDARTLACMIADPERVTATQADKWVKELDYYLLSDLFSSLIAKSKHAQSRSIKWMKSKNEFVRQSGYSTLASMIKNGELPKKTEAKTILKAIEKEIHSSPNRARYSMNTVLISIGSYMPELTETAFDVAQKIGKVEIDHGDTSCKTPDAISYMKKTIAYNQKKKK